VGFISNVSLPQTLDILERHIFRLCYFTWCCQWNVKENGKGFPYSLPSIGADPGVQAVSLQVTINHPPSGMECNRRKRRHSR